MGPYTTLAMMSDQAFAAALGSVSAIACLSSLAFFHEKTRRLKLWRSQIGFRASLACLSGAGIAGISAIMMTAKAVSDSHTHGLPGNVTPFAIAADVLPFFSLIIIGGVIGSVSAAREVMRLSEAWAIDEIRAVSSCASFSTVIALSMISLPIVSAYRNASITAMNDAEYVISHGLKDTGPQVSEKDSGYVLEDAIYGTRILVSCDGSVPIATARDAEGKISVTGYRTSTWLQIGSICGDINKRNTAGE